MEASPKAQRPDTSVFSQTVRELQKDIDALIDSPDFTNAGIGIAVVSVKSGEALYKKNDKLNFIPASTQKIITTSAALEFLGPDFKFQTKLYLDGETMPNGEFRGNMIVRGFADPTLNSFFYENIYEIFDTWIKDLDSLGISSIKGNMIGDDNYFDDAYYGPGWSWDDMIYPFSAQVNGLDYYDNKVDISIEAGDEPGQTARIKIIPENSYVQVINNVTTVEAGQVSGIETYREPLTNIIELQGGIAADTGNVKNVLMKSVTIDNPTLFFLNVFKERLAVNNIRFRGALIDIDDWNEKVSYYKLIELTPVESAELKSVLAVINKESNNLMSEIVLKSIAREKAGYGTFEGGKKLVEEYLLKAGVAISGMSYVDGSGLSRFNLQSPAVQIAVLSYIGRSDYKDIFKATLARPGNEGSLKRRMTQSLAEKNVVAKTGSMNNVSAICGYVTTRDKEELAFSIMMNNFTVPPSAARNLQDLILMRLASFSRLK